MKKIDFTCEIEEHEKFFYSHLPECKRRQYAGLEAMKIGYNGVALISKKFGIHIHTVRKGKNELLNRIVPPVGKIRQKGGGKKTFVIKGLTETLLSILTSYTAGSPMDCDIFRTSLTLSQIQEKLTSCLIFVSRPVIKKLLKSCRFVKRKMRKCKTPKDVENRNEQFEYIAKIRKRFMRQNLPVGSPSVIRKEWFVSDVAASLITGKKTGKVMNASITVTVKA